MLIIIHHIFVKEPLNYFSVSFRCALKLLEWFSNNDMKMDSDKYYSILSCNNENKKIELNGEVINNIQIQNLLHVHDGYKLQFDAQIECL